MVEPLTLAELITPLEQMVVGAESWCTEVLAAVDSELRLRLLSKPGLTTADELMRLRTGQSPAIDFTTLRRSLRVHAPSNCIQEEIRRALRGKVLENGERAVGLARDVHSKQKILVGHGDRVMGSTLSELNGIAQTCERRLQGLQIDPVRIQYTRAPGQLRGLGQELAIAREQIVHLRICAQGLRTALLPLRRYMGIALLCGGAAYLVYRYAATETMKQA